MSGTITPTTYTGMTVVTDGFKTVVEFDNNVSIGVLSFNSRGGVVTLQSADVTGALGYTPISTVSPAFTGTPTAPTATLGTSTTQLATTAFVANAISSIGSGVTSFNTRTGMVTLGSADVTGALGYTPLSAASPSITTPTISSPTLTGTPVAPTATVGTNTTQIATTAFVQTAVSGSVAGVSSFNSRTGAVTLTGSDVLTALTYTPANISSPTFVGVPTAPTPSSSDNSTTIATTAFVKANLTSAGVSSFNTRTGAVTLSTADILSAAPNTYTAVGTYAGSLITVNVGGTSITAGTTYSGSSVGLGSGSWLCMGPTVSNPSGCGPITATIIFLRKA
jgi:hypothetical protein